MNNWAFFLILVLSSSLFFANSYAFTNGNSETKTPQNFYPYGHGILEFQQTSAGPCNLIPAFELKTVNPSKGDALLNLDNVSNNFFVVLGNKNSDSYQYMQMELPAGTGFSSYLLDFNKDNEKIRGEFYVDYQNLAVLVESDNEETQTSESYEKYFEGKSKDITSSMHAFGPGNYTLGAILLKSANSSWIKNDTCAIRVDWHVMIYDDGKIVSDTPTTQVGILSDSTYKFSPRAQHKYGVNSIECKPGLYVISQVDGSGDKRPSCVKPDTASELIHRGWTKNLWQVHKSNAMVIISPDSASPEHSSPIMPKEVRIILAENSTVTWTNKDSIVHALVSDTGGDDMWQTGMIKPGESSSVTFNQTGIFGYHGEPGPWITGKVIVSEP